ncbi:MAG TPA: hypothetical protein VN229_10880, partial [Terriglobales bacterium]|nr:hypothetical protein [Terriglobales bacterium]
MMQNTPTSATIRGEDVPREDWDRAPWNRWSFQHVREIVPTTTVWRGPGPVSSLPRNLQAIDAIS